MTCADLEQLLDRFLDSQLPPPMLLAVAKHAAECPACDDAVQGLARVQEAVASTVRQAAQSIDLSGVWAKIERDIGRTTSHDVRVEVASRPWRRRLRGAPMWASLAAIAASALLWVRTPIERPGRTPARTASARRTNHTVIDRLAGKDIAVRREPKTGTTIIWVNYTP